MEIDFRQATLEDIRFIGENLRESDRAEIEALGLRPSFAVRCSFEESDEAYTGTVDGEPAMIFGVGGTPLSDETSIWALGTPLCDKVPVSMVRLGRNVVNAFLEDYPVLTNHCDSRYKKTIKWLRMLGFTVGEPEPYGEKGALFCKLIIQKED